MMYMMTPEQHAQIVDALSCVINYPKYGVSQIALNIASETLKAMQPVSPCAYRFTENRGNGNTEFEYYGLDEVGLAYRDNCLEIVDLYTPTKD